MSRLPRFQLISGQSDATRWRLLGANNVSLGVGAIDYADVAECLAAIKWLCGNIDRTRVEFKHHSGIQWRWVIHDDTGAIATASHPYGRRIEARRAFDRFVSAVGTATAYSENGKISDWRTKYRIDS
ncbi:DUF1508 domain-containing protein [Amycolatopsis sp. GM8]|uniref:DUF1508 domain-containing protein n=1 Tax=Amycolatopsis sp. GM8 TaxID=2896530 RepID=UPI001F3F290A|nr:DUF1508 domain-containing protein [Amycolatopsis sp. GM8]